MQYYDIIGTPTPEDPVPEVEEDVEELKQEMRKYHIKDIILSPQRWRKFTNKTPLNWNKVKFAKEEAINLPKDKQGVYTLVICPEIANHPLTGYLMYVGKTERQGFRKRFMQYIRDKTSPKARPRIKELVNYWEDNLWFYYAVVDDVTLIDQLEDDLISAYIPHANDDFSGILSQAVKALR